MKMKSLFLLSFIGFTFFHHVVAQVEIGQWQDHLPYAEATYVAESETHIYTSTAEAVFSYHKSTGEIERLNKVTGLSDVGVESLAYNHTYDVLIIGYSNGNIDLLEQREIINISDIKRKSIASEKRINHILLIDQFALLSTGFGIVVLDVDRQEIRSTWYIADMGAFLNVNETVFDGQYVYAATENGVYKGDYLNDNLADFNQWEVLTDIPFGTEFSWLSEQPYNTLAFFNNKLIVNKQQPDLQNRDTLFVYENDSWAVFPDTSIHQCNYLTGDDEMLIINRDYDLVLMDTSLSDKSNVYIYKFNATGETKSPRPSIALPGMDDQLIIADYLSGLVRHNGLWNDQSISLNGPFSSAVFDISSGGDKVYMSAGGLTLSWGPTFTSGEINFFNDNAWDYLNYEKDSVFDNFKDIVNIKVNPQNPNQIFAGSWIHGLMELRNNQVFTIYNEANSTLQSVSSADYVRIGGMDFDENQNLWVVNSGSDIPIHMLTPDGEWIGLDYSSEINAFNLGELIVTENNHKWVVLPRGGGLFAFDDNGTPDDTSDDRTKKFSIIDEYGQTISNEVFSIAEDLNGSIWVGTNIGVVVYYNPEDVFDEDLIGYRVLIPRNDGTNNADILLGAEIVTDIEIDGANKKWFATESGGVFKTSADGVEEIYHFNQDNSPLFSNNVLCLNIIQETGDVFFGTDKGVLSYRSEATKGEDDYSDVYTFPNPVEPGYEGPITVHGLLSNSIVKITDISGNLVFETRSEGGQAIWYGKNLNGERVQTGVYLVFSANDDGTQSHVTKILFIN
jgi:hypothetical protein